MVSSTRPEKKLIIAASIVMPQTITVGIFSTVPVWKKLTSTGMKKAAEITKRSNARSEKNAKGL